MTQLRARDRLVPHDRRRLHAALFEVSFSEVAELRGDIADATSAMAAALDVGSECGFRSSTVLRAVLCWLTGRNGETERALDLGREVVALAHQPFNPVIRAQALFALGAAETRADLPEAASEHLGEALTIHQQVGMKRETAMDHRHLGILRHRLGDSAGAIAHLVRAVELAVEVGPAVDGDACGQVDGAASWSIPIPSWPRSCWAPPRPSATCSVTYRLPTNANWSTPRWPPRRKPSDLEAVARAVAAGSQVSYTDLPALVAAS